MLFGVMVEIPRIKCNQGVTLMILLHLQLPPPAQLII